MESNLNKEQPEDELVRIEAESAEALRKGFKNGKLKVPNNVVLLSRAIKVMDEFVEEMTEYGGYDGKTICFDVYACRDDVLLFCYMNGEVFNDHRNDARPKSLDKVLFYLMDGGETPPKEIYGAKKVVYAEWAEREMDRYLEKFFLTHQLICESGRSTKEINPENLYFNVYGGKEGNQFLFSYKNSQKISKPVTEEQVQKTVYEEGEIENR